jgi:MYXO-CTERM domain-containing protein
MPTRRRPVPRARRSLPGAAAFAALLGAAAAFAAPGALAADRSVRIEDFAFSPRSITVAAGDRVRWTNRDAVEHTATARNGSFDTGLLGQGETGSVRFTIPGTYRYVCTPHPTMTGTIVVRAAAGARPPDTSTVSGDRHGGSGPGDVDPGGPRGVALALLGLVVLLAARVLRRRAETTAASRT